MRVGYPRPDRSPRLVLPGCHLPERQAGSGHTERDERAKD